MITVNIRKQGGAAVITIPSDILRLLNLDIGATLALEVSNNGFTANPVKESTEKQHLTLAELLEGTSPHQLKSMKEKTKWFRDSKSTGREIP